MVRVIRLRYPRIRKIDDATPEDLAYLAGMIDGEGSFYIAKKKDLFRPCFEMGQKNADFLVGLVGYYGIGSFHLAKKNRGYQCEWQISRRNELRKFVKLIIPYLKLKKVQAKLVLEAIGIMEEKPNDIKTQLSDLKGRISQLNKQSPAPPPELLEQRRKRRTL